MRAGMLHLHGRVMTGLFMTISFLFAIDYQAAAQANQDPGNKLVTLPAGTLPIVKAFSSIEQQTGLVFMYNNRHVPADQTVTTTGLSNVKLDEALKVLLLDKKLSWQYNRKNIIIKPVREHSESIKDTGGDTARTISFSGKVTDSTGLPLSGATIMIKEANLYTISDIQGNFSLKDAPKNALVSVTYTGFEPNRFRVRPDNNMQVTMKRVVSQLSEMIIPSTGYQNIPKERVTGSFVQLDNDLINRNTSTNIMDRLEGVASGVIFNRGGGSTSVTVRGTSTIQAPSAPLIVLDNFPYDGSLSNINPNDIESITILKDAAAASIWGVQSGNGVIVMTTKKGRYNRRPKVELNSNVTVFEKPDLFYDRSFLGSSDYIGMEQFLFDKGFFNNDISNITSRPVLTPSIEIMVKQRAGLLSPADAAAQLDELKNHDVRNDLRKYVYRTAINQQYSLSVRGGSDNVAYSFSAGFDKNLNELIRNGISRLTMNSLNTFKPVKNLEITTGVIYTYTQLDNNNTNSIRGLNSGKKYGSVIYPYAQLIGPDGSHIAIERDYRSAYTDSMQQLGFLDWKYRPLDEIQYADNTQKTNDLLFKTEIRYHINVDWNVQFQFQNKKQITEDRNLETQSSYRVRDLINQFTQRDLTTGRLSYPFPMGSILSLDRSELSSNYFRLQSNYSKYITSRHQITALAGAEIRQVKSMSYSRGFYGYDDEFGTSVVNLNYQTSYPKNPSSSSTIAVPNSGSVIERLNRYISYYANASYSLDNKYTLYASGRRDGANLFGVKTNQKVVPLWSVGANWDINKEKFYHVGWLPYLKFRASYGFNGNIYDGTAFLIARYRNNDLLTGLSYTDIVSAPNPQLRWEKVRNINLGLDFSIIGDVLSGSIDVYQKMGTDLVEDIPLPPSSGFVSYKGNAAKTSTKGLDLVLNSHNIKGVFNWYTNFLFSLQKDKVVEFEKKALATDLVGNTNSIVAYVGNPLYGLYSYGWAGLDHATGDPLGYIDGKPSNDYLNIIQNVTPESLVFHGSARANIYGAIRNTFTWKGLNLSFNISYKFDYFFRRSSTSINYQEAIYDPHMDYTRRWLNPGDETFTNVPSLVYPSNTRRDDFYGASAVLVEKGDHIRLQDVNIGYELTQSRHKKVPFTTLRPYIYLNNLGLLWKANKAGLDPDYYNSPYPVKRSIALGLKATF